MPISFFVIFAPFCGFIKLESKPIAGIHTIKEIYSVKRKLGYFVEIPRHGKNLTEKVDYR